jgi:RNA polymerase sigma-32 factor
MDDNDHYVAPAAYLTDGRMDPAQQLEASQWGEHNTERLQEALETLDERSHDILAQRWLREEKSTLHKLADKYQVSAERIRQLEASAIKKLKVALLA